MIVVSGNSKSKIERFGEDSISCLYIILHTLTHFFPYLSTKETNPIKSEVTK